MKQEKPNDVNGVRKVRNLLAANEWLRAFPSEDFASSRRLGSDRPYRANGAHAGFCPAGNRKGAKRLSPLEGQGHFVMRDTRSTAFRPALLEGRPDPELRRRQEALLDEALMETFPASDPISPAQIA